MDFTAQEAHEEEAAVHIEAVGEHVRRDGVR